MKRPILLIVCTLAAGLLAFGLTRWACAPRMAGPGDEIAWMQSEFKLTPSQVAVIEKLHDDYHPVCMDHCKRILQARKNLASAPDKTAAQAELLRLEAVCHDATLAHLQRVAAVMTPDQGARFLSLVQPKVSGQSHHAPLGLK